MKNVEFRVEPAPPISGAPPLAIADLKSRRTDELVIALVGPIGSGCSKCGSILSRILSAEFGYKDVAYHKMSAFIGESATIVGVSWDGSLTGPNRIERLQDIGNKLRQSVSADFVAAKAIQKISEQRKKRPEARHAEDGVVAEPRRCAHVIDSLKNPEELRLLREVYGDMLWVFGVFAPEEVRKYRLKNMERWDEKALADLFQRDIKQPWNYGQGVRDVFCEADFFIRNDGENDEAVTRTIRRHLGAIFGEPVSTPTRDESAMYAAHAAASMSACLSRQVGAAILASTGELLGVGWNDVPRFGGGLYNFEDGQSDNRCFKWGGRLCHNDQRKGMLYEEIFTELSTAGFLKDEVTLDEAVKVLRETDIRQLVEYSRAVHAEMDDLIAVARAGKSGLNGATLYCTTFPCHPCARHLLAAGISRVVYIEPYPKSLALDLHRDATSSNDKDQKSKMVLQQYEGVSPRNLLRLFKPKEFLRKVDGKLAPFLAFKARTQSSVSMDSFASHEERVLRNLEKVEGDAARQRIEGENA